MLVLSRHKDEYLDLFIDGVKIAEILISEIRGDKVRIGISAPLEVSVCRREISVKAYPQALETFRLAQLSLEIAS